MIYSNKLPKGTNFIIDPEFEALIPPLSDDEFGRLRENIIEVGECRDPLIVWYVPGTQSDYIIIDGHNRWKIIQEFIDTDSPISFAWRSEIFFTREEVKLWMIRNQLGRRNVPPYVRAELALKLKPLIAKEAKENQGTRTDILPNSAKSNPPKNTRQEIAKIAGVSGDTVAKVEKIVESAPEEVKADLRAGRVSVNKAYSNLTAKCNADFSDIEPEHVDKKKALDKINRAWKKRDVDSLVVEIKEHTRLMTDATWCDVAYGKEFYTTDEEKEKVAAALEESLNRISFLLGNLAKRIRESKSK